LIWAYGSYDSATGFILYTVSGNTLNARVGDTLLTGPAIVAGRTYHFIAGRDAAGNCWFWLNGGLVASGSGATAAASAVANTLVFLGDGTAVRSYAGSIAAFGMGKENPLPFGPTYSENFWKMFSPPRRVWAPQIGPTLATITRQPSDTNVVLVSTASFSVVAFPP
jgi:hypothetical protein